MTFVPRWSRMSTVVVVLALAGFASSTSRLLGQSSSPVPRPAFAIPPEPFNFRPGDTLSLRTLVQRPPVLPGVISWTIESRRHRGPLTVMSLSPDGKLLATGGVDGNVRVWNAESGAFVRALVGHGTGVIGLAWSPDGNALASVGGSDGTARLWDASTGMTIRTLKGHKGYTHHVAWAPDGQSIVVAGGTSGFVTLWDLVKGEQVRTVEVGSTITAVAWSPNNRDVAISGRASGVQVRELRQNTSSFQGMLPDQYGTAVAWSPDGKTIVGGSPTKTIVWDVESGSQTHELDTPAVGVAFSPDGSSLAVSSGIDVKLWPTAKFAEKPKLFPIVTSRPVGWAVDGASFFSMVPASVSRWSVEPPKAAGLIDAAGDAVVLVAPNRPFITGLNTKSLTLWDPATAKMLAVLEGHTAVVTATAWSRDGKFLATASADKTIRVWDATGKPVKTLAGHEAAVSCVAWADDRTLASGSTDKTIRIWQATTDAAPRVLPVQTHPVTALAWSRDGRMLATGTDKKVQLWQADADKPSQTIPVAAGVRSLAWTGTGKSIAVSVLNGELQVFNTVGGKLLQAFGREGTTPAISLSWAADGITLLISRSYVAQVLRTGSATPVVSLNGLAPVAQATWGINGSVFVSCTDRTGRVYDQASGVLRATVVSEAATLTVVSAAGHYRATDDAENELVYVVQTPTTQETLSPKEFAARFRFKNLPATVSLPGGK